MPFMRPGKTMQNVLQGCSPMKRIRFAFSKRRLCCFIPHVVLPQVFARAGLRAGVSFEYSEGFSPRPRISIGPALPVGVIGLEELFDAELSFWDPYLMDKWNFHLPEGIQLMKACETEGPSLGKACKVASYKVYMLIEVPFSIISEAITTYLPQGSILNLGPCHEGGSFSIDILDPQQNSPGHLIKALTCSEIINSWSDVRIVRKKLGFIDGKNIRPLI